MENYLRERVRARLDALGINPFEAARRIGAERTFLNDLLIGKKDTIRRSAIPKVAAALECDPAYLLGAQDAPRLGSAERPETATETGNSGLPLVGIAESGTWRLAQAQNAATRLPVAHDPRYPAAAQVAYLVRGDHAYGMGATDGSVVVGISGAGYRDGDVVVVRRSRETEDGREEEITIRRANGEWLECKTAGSGVSRIRPQDAEILARALSAHKVF